MLTKKQRYHPDHYDSGFRSGCRRLESQWEAYSIPSVDRYESQRQNADTHRHCLK